MGSFNAIAATGKSIENLLNACFSEEQPLDTATATAKLVTTEDFKTLHTVPITGVTLFFYRLDVNASMRAAWSAVGARDGRAHLPLDLCFLLTAWASNGEHELQILGRAMQCLDTTPILSGPLLSGTGEWAPNEAIQIVLGEITTEEVMRTFDSLPTDYKLSVPYIARVLRLDGRPEDDAELAEVTTAVAGLTPTATP